jgi:hypothetical protein
MEPSFLLAIQSVETKQPACQIVMIPLLDAGGLDSDA